MLLAYLHLFNGKHRISSHILKSHVTCHEEIKSFKLASRLDFSAIPCHLLRAEWDISVPSVGYSERPAESNGHTINL